MKNKNIVNLLFAQVFKVDIETINTRYLYYNLIYELVTVCFLFMLISKLTKIAFKL